MRTLMIMLVYLSIVFMSGRGCTIHFKSAGSSRREDSFYWSAIGYTNHTCEAVCLADDLCAAYSYNSFDGACKKSHNSEPRNAHSCPTCSFTHKECGTDCPVTYQSDGPDKICDDPYATVNNIDLATCQSDCSAAQRCISFCYNPSGNRCSFSELNVAEPMDCPSCTHHKKNCNFNLVVTTSSSIAGLTTETITDTSLEHILPTSSSSIISTTNNDNTSPSSFDVGVSTTNDITGALTLTIAEQIMPTMSGQSETTAVQTMPTTSGPSETATVQTMPTMSGQSETTAVQTMPTMSGQSETTAVQTMPTTSGPSDTTAVQTMPTTSGLSETATVQTMPTTSGQSETTAAQTMPTTPGQSETTAAQTMPTTPGQSETTAAQTMPSSIETLPYSTISTTRPKLTLPAEEETSMLDIQSTSKMFTTKLQVTATDSTNAISTSAVFEHSTLVQITTYETATWSSVSVNSPLLTNNSSTLCFCQCFYDNETTIRERMEVRQIYLKINKKELSSFKRSRISASDPRYSSKVAGSLGIFVFTLIVLLVTVPDLSRAAGCVIRKFNIYSNINKQKSTNDKAP